MSRRRMATKRRGERSRARRWLLRLGLIALVPAACGGTLLATAWSEIGDAPSGERLERISQSPQFDPEVGRFVNRLEQKDQVNFDSFWEWVVGRPNTTPAQPPPVVANTAEVLSEPPPSELRVTWFGHSSVLVEVDGAHILTDPVWGPRAAPWSFLGPKRFHEPPVPLEELPDIDAVVISHDHYDHLDAPTIRELADRTPLFLVPLGVGARLESWGVAPERVVELDWWQEREVAGVRVVATPARHFSGRSIVDSNKTLWASWSMVGPRHRVYFSGDTAMFPGFRDIGERLGPFDIAMIESGAYNRTWADVHLGPEQALQAFEDVRGEVFMPVHWGTFDLALHAWTEPAERILAGAEERGIEVTIPRAGQSIEPSKLPPLERWWPEVPWDTVEVHAIVSSGLGP